MNAHNHANFAWPHERTGQQLSGLGANDLNLTGRGEKKAGGEFVVGDSVLVQDTEGGGAVDRAVGIKTQGDFSVRL